MTESQRRELYALGHTDTPDRLAPARGVINAVALLVVTTAGVISAWYALRLWGHVVVAIAGT